MNYGGLSHRTGLGGLDTSPEPLVDPSRGHAHVPPLSLLTHVRFSSRMELRMKVGFRDREMCTRSCNSAGRRAGWAEAGQVPGLPRPPPNGSRSKANPYPTIPSRSICLLLLVPGNSSTKAYRPLGTPNLPGRCPDAAPSHPLWAAKHRHP